MTKCFENSINASSGISLKKDGLGSSKVSMIVFSIAQCSCLAIAAKKCICLQTFINNVYIYAPSNSCCVTHILRKIVV